MHRSMHADTCTCSPWRTKVVRDLSWVMGSPHLLQPHLDLTPVLPDSLSTSLVRLSVPSSDPPSYMPTLAQFLHPTVSVVFCPPGVVPVQYPRQ